ncbi:MAG: hypothetical protein COV36_06600 [Alphaproteobacteria bacterium CG11_big_fil_rev_8_21_14_0_20_44_7]|nr:MAG: hypothetical protein COV36_06600 [Alphaproteobacteria bacterium CG11_big_fil_rev_8_21_14_0_20_44_7]
MSEVKFTKEKVAQLSEAEQEIVRDFWKTIRKADFVDIQGVGEGEITYSELKNFYKKVENRDKKTDIKTERAGEAIEKLMETKLLSKEDFPLTSAKIVNLFSSIVEFTAPYEAIAFIQRDGKAKAILGGGIAPETLEEIYDDNKDGHVTFAELYDTRNGEEVLEAKKSITAQLEAWYDKNADSLAPVSAGDLPRKFVTNEELAGKNK